MPDSRFTPDEKGTDAESRQTSTEPHTNQKGDKAKQATPTREEAQSFPKGVIFLLDEDGHQQYWATNGEVDEAAQRKGSQLYANTLLFRDRLNDTLRTTYDISYDPLDTRFFGALEDILTAVPSSDVAGGKWMSASILTHATSGNVGHTRIESGLWIPPNPYFARDFREYANNGSPEYTGLREKFDPSGGLNILICGAERGTTDLACALLAFFGLEGSATIPKGSITVRADGALYTKAGGGGYRKYNPKFDTITIDGTQCD